MKYNILLAGVGGQGLMLLSGVLGEACTINEINVVVSEQHGLAQRSGSISAHVRIGDVYSPLIPYGSADLIIAMEAMEALRYIEYLKRDGTIITSTRVMHPVIETNTLVEKRKEQPEYVSLEAIMVQLKKWTMNIYDFDAKQLAAEVGNPRSENIVLLGAASELDEFPLNKKQLKEAVVRIVPPRTVDSNLAAFEFGAQAMTVGQQ